MIEPPTVLGKKIKEGEGSDMQLKGLVILEAACPRVLDDMEYEFARPLFGGLDNALVGQLG